MRVEVEHGPVHQPGIANVQLLVEQGAVLSAQLPLRRSLASVAGQIERLLDHVMQLLARLYVEALRLPRDNDHKVDVVIMMFVMWGHSEAPRAKSAVVISS